MTTTIEAMADRLLDRMITDEAAGRFEFVLSGPNSLLLPRSDAPKWAVTEGLEAEQAYRGFPVETWWHEDSILVYPICSNTTPQRIRPIYVRMLRDGQIITGMTRPTKRPHQP